MAMNTMLIPPVQWIVDVSIALWENHQNEIIGAVGAVLALGLFLLIMNDTGN